MAARKKRFVCVRVCVHVCVCLVVPVPTLESGLASVCLVFCGLFDAFTLSKRPGKANSSTRQATVTLTVTVTVSHLPTTATARTSSQELAQSAAWPGLACACPPPAPALFMPHLAQLRIRWQQKVAHFFMVFGVERRFSSRIGVYSHTHTQTP